MPVGQGDLFSNDELPLIGQTEPARFTVVFTDPTVETAPTVDDAAEEEPPPRLADAINDGRLERYVAVYRGNQLLWTTEKSADQVIDETLAELTALVEERLKTTVLPGVGIPPDPVGTDPTQEQAVPPGEFDRIILDPELEARIRNSYPLGVVTTTLESGKVTYDANRPVRGSIDVSFGSLPVDVPIDSGEPLSNLTLKAFVRMAGGVRILLGEFQVDNPAFGYDEGTVTVDIAGADASQPLADFSLLEKVVIPKGGDPVYVLAALLHMGAPNVPVKLRGSTGVRMAEISFEVGTPYLEVITTLTTTAGLAFWWDPDEGAYIIGAPPVLGQGLAGASFTLAENDGKLLTVSRSLNRQGRRNAIVVRGESLAEDGPPVESRAIGDLSEGHMVELIVDRGITTQLWADIIALVRLSQTQGTPETVSLVAVIDPSVRVGQTVALSVPSLGISGNYLVTRVEFPLTGSPIMSITTAENRKAP